MTKTHNKKRNPVVLYEVLVKEISKSLLEKNLKRAKEIVSLVKQKFGNNTNLSRELKLYEDILQFDGDIKTLKKIIKESKKEFDNINKHQLNKEKSYLISIINKNLGAKTFSNYVDNYRNAAAIYNIFNSKTVKDRVLKEEQYLKNYQMFLEEKEIIDTVLIEKSNDEYSEIVLHKFITRFNQEYKNLLKEQKILLTNLVQNGDDSLEFKFYLNEEIGALKSKLRSLTENVEDPYIEDYNRLLNLLEGYKKEPITPQMYKQVLKIQQIVYGE